jgi:hypothetical protein
VRVLRKAVGLMATTYTCAECGSPDALPCAVCKKPVCGNHRMGSGSVSDGYECSMACSVERSFPRPPPLPRLTKIWDLNPWVWLLVTSPLWVVLGWLMFLCLRPD